MPSRATLILATYAVMSLTVCPCTPPSREHPEWLVALQRFKAEGKDFDEGEAAYLLAAAESGRFVPPPPAPITVGSEDSQGSNGQASAGSSEAAQLERPTERASVAVESAPMPEVPEDNTQRACFPHPLDARLLARPESVCE